MAIASLTVSLSADLPGERIAQLTRDFKRDLSSMGIQVLSIEASPLPGERGEPVTLGVLTLALITHGAVTALIECLKAYLSRERTLSIKLTRADGTQVEVIARNVDTPAVRDVLEAVAVARLE